MIRWEINKDGNSYASSGDAIITIFDAGGEYHVFIEDEEGERFLVNDTFASREEAWDRVEKEIGGGDDD
jgi:hypothetical protein